VIDLLSRQLYEMSAKKKQPEITSLCEAKYCSRSEHVVFAYCQIRAKAGVQSRTSKRPVGQTHQPMNLLALLDLAPAAKPQLEVEERCRMAALLNFSSSCTGAARRVEPI
jgi:hypothetical protein